MIYDILIYSAVLIACVWGAYQDMKSTFVSDWVHISIVLSAFILHILGNPHNILYGLATAIPFLAFGYVLVRLNVWGEADMLLLAAIGFAIPQPLVFFNVAQGIVYPLAIVALLFGCILVWGVGGKIAQRSLNKPLPIVPAFVLFMLILPFVG